MVKTKANMEKIAWSGRIVSVQPRIRLMRSFDERSHNYQGYVLRLEGTIGDGPGEFQIAVGKAAQVKHRFRAGMEASGLAVPIPDPRLETAEFYKASGLKVLKDAGADLPVGPPFHGEPPDLETYRSRGHLSAVLRSGTGRSPSGRQDLRGEMYDLCLGLPDAGGNDHRPLESLKKTVPVREILLRPEKLLFLPGRTGTQGAGAQGHVLHRGGLGRRRRHLAPGTG